MYAKQRQVASNAWNGGSWNNLRARARAHTHTHTHVYIRAWGESRVKEDERGGGGMQVMYGCRQPWSRGYFAEGLGSRSNPEGCLVLKLPSTLAGQKPSLLCSGDGLFHAGNKPVELRTRDPLSVPCSYPRQPAESSAERWKPPLASVRVQRPNLSLSL